VDVLSQLTRIDPPLFIYQAGGREHLKQGALKMQEWKMQER